MINKQVFFRTIYIYVISYFVLLLAILGSGRQPIQSPAYNEDYDIFQSGSQP